MNKEQQGIEIDLMQLARTLWENAKYIVLVTVIMGLLGFAGSTIFLTPVYEASAKMIVNTRKDDTQNITNDQINSAKNLVDTYAVIIRSRDVLNRVIAELNLEESYGQLAECVSVHAVNNTQIMEIVVRHKSPGIAQAVAAKLLEISPDVIVATVEAGSVKAVENAHTTPNPIAPNVFKNAVIMAMLGFVLTCGVVVVVFLSDNTYKTDLDLQNDLDVPVLGVIPTAESCKDYSKYGYPARGRK